MTKINNIARLGRALAITLAVAATTSVTTVGCRTNASRAQDANDLQAGMAMNTMNATQRASWAVRMGLTLADGRGGAAVSAVAPAMYASVIGIQAGDTITALNGVAIAKAGDFDTVANSFAGNTQAAAAWNGIWVLGVQRSGQQLSLQTVAGYDCDPYLVVGCGPLNISGGI